MFVMRMLLAIGLTALSSAYALPPADPVVGYTRNGSYLGFHVPQPSSEVFLGIPYAHARRLRIADSLNETWTGAHNATRYGLTCPGWGDQNDWGWPIGEDCLNIDIARPVGTTPDQRLPVMVWIYGGGFYQGAIRDPMMNLGYMVQTSTQIDMPVLVVSVNSRLAGYGYLNSEETVREGIANLGLRDLWKALEWIQENIEGFGGDTSRVTIWGESSGGLSVELLAQAYSGQNSGLFHAGIISSVTAYSPFMGTMKQQQGYFDSVSESTGCNSSIEMIDCLRNLPLQQYNASLYAANSGTDFRPVIDGDFLKNSPSSQFSHQQMAPVALLLGANSDEGLTTFINSANTSEELVELVQEKFALNASTSEEIVALYADLDTLPPYSQSLDVDWVAQAQAAGFEAGNWSRVGYAIGGDWSAISGRRKTAQRWNEGSGQPVYSYRFDTDPWRFPIHPESSGLGLGFAQHGSDLCFEFRIPYAPYTPYLPIQNVTAMHHVSYALQATWISFASTKDPNHHGLDWIPHWPEYTTSRQNFVYNATLSNTLNLHVEEDSWRESQIQWWIDRWDWLLTQAKGF
ncbi:alpha/beta-hydrolase [Aspergillus heteromorphus CBS 117.55]|uniref:Carboxylic ester hydrolase n=1 Tax=Aspergillus heteromorphus CBS 117.55 TaxID=1448321 RepID=A0A317WJR8_9EURO|nr:alpha/beta-hydrolase [Aspergillus heteromorphus CBS 117.55]PWY86686.1 alpha/beta-hydrolase [Aspergillus heteromorphus CBS 117.55]